MNIYEGIFFERPHRFGAIVDINGEAEYVHVKNTGRCKELLIPGTKVYLEKSSNPNRKTAYSLISVQKDRLLINIDSQVPNQVVEDAIRENKIQQFADLAFLKREVTYENSRFDLYFERKNKSKGFIEVKGVTLDIDGTAMFPDAPTKRGTKHLLELKKAYNEGYETYIFFLIQYRPVKRFIPNYATDPVFSNTLNKVSKKGVTAIAFDSIVTVDSIDIGKQISLEILPE